MKWLWLFVAGVMLSGCAAMQFGSPLATAELRNAKGETVGSASFWEDGNGVRIVAQVRGIPAGRHGTHLHAVGKCDPPEFTTAGGHFNPGGKKHGLKNPAGPHAGDLPNLEVAADGTGRFEYVTKLVTLASGPTSLFDADGSALVIHANPDDDVTDPTGNSGGRIACGVIRRAPQPAPRPTSGY
ncbi:MAG: superoxide dismutase family protein [Candidatus Rokubacteria bacterium]|nr:superoxide dismutase family protein [Candidatus Rokubacteria bacterium]